MELDVIDQLQIVAIMSRREVQEVLMVATLCCMGILFLIALSKIFKNICKRIANALKKMGLFSAMLSVVIITPMVVKAVQNGSTKEDKPKKLWTFEYVNGVYDRGSYCINDEIHAWWRYDPPSRDYTIMASYQDLTITNAHGFCEDELHPLPECPVIDGYHVWNVANATNMRVVVYASYVAPPNVRTNGVYQIEGVMPAISNATKYVTPGISIWVNFETGESKILTPTNRPPVASINDIIIEEINE